MIECICPVCGMSYQASAVRLKHGKNTTCSRECSYKLRGSQKSIRVQLICVRCGKSFTRVPSVLDKKGRGQYCSRECHNPPIIKRCPFCNKEFRVSPSEIDQQYCNPDCANKSGAKSEKSRIAVNAMWADPQQRAKRIESIKLRSQTDEWKSAPHFQKGPLHPKYKGNVAARREGMSRYEYKKWRMDVFRRDNFTCQICGKRGGKLQAHHIKEWAKYPDARYEVDNGMTVCKPCHNQIHHKR